MRQTFCAQDELGKQRKKPNTKAKTVFDALKLHFPHKRIVTIFEPHTFSWRNKQSLHWYKNIFKDSDVTIILNPPEHGKSEHDQATLEEILKEINQSDTYGVKNKEGVFEILNKEVREGDLIILMSSGGMWGLIEEIPAWAEKKFPKL